MIHHYPPGCSSLSLLASTDMDIRSEEDESFQVSLVLRGFEFIHKNTRISQGVTSNFLIGISAVLGPVFTSAIKTIAIINKSLLTQGPRVKGYLSHVMIETLMTGLQRMINVPGVGSGQ